MTRLSINGIAQQGCGNAEVNQHTDLGSVNFELESAIGLLKEAQGEEAISDLAMLLEDCK